MAALTRVLAAVLAVIAYGESALAQYGGSECYELWYQRNAIYKAKGYCFRTSRAISEFGNAGCIYDNEWDVPLSRSDRQRVARIQAQERRLGCR
jgi:hypothetical protein